jgi:hypothetical protein
VLCHPDHALRDRDNIVPTLYLCVSRTEVLLMASNTSYHKRLHGLHRFIYHIFASFAACKRLAILTHDFRREGSIFDDDINTSATICHTPFRDRGNEGSIRVPRMFKSHV